MAASPTPRPTAEPTAPAGADRFPALQDAFAAILRGPAPRLPVAVALSGGADSTALLLLAARAFPGRPGEPAPVRAIHVHHGLQDAADAFQRHCEALCERLRVPLQVVRVQARNAPGESPEDAARQARYAALAQAAREPTAGGGAGPAPTVWLGHHADDQAETLLLALSRGAGLPGLAAMPAHMVREGVVFERPLLSVPGPVIRQWLRGEGVAWVEDPTNADTAFTRNRIRHDLLPALEAAFPQFRDTFARSARHAAQAQVLLEQVAAQDLAALGGEPRIAGLQGLTRERQANLLRHWLRAAHQAAPSAAQLGELLAQVDACRTRGHRIRLKVATGFVERDGERLAYRVVP